MPIKVFNTHTGIPIRLDKIVAVGPLKQEAGGYKCNNIYFDIVCEGNTVCVKYTEQLYTKLLGKQTFDYLEIWNLVKEHREDLINKWINQDII